ncbi:PAS domain S-box protein [Desulfuromonas sp.]|uniref:PAS domain S-box protein n=1 Tax=Desulfuromonas sp. TaxID=892 RepID=UPI00342371A8
MGFLPAHALPRISADFRNGGECGISFNNVSARPRNPDNAADAVEVEAIDYYRKNPEAKERLARFSSEDGRAFFHYSSPLWVEADCLQCHGNKADAPPAIRARYDSGFAYQVGDLCGILSIKLPAEYLEKRIASQQQDHVLSLFAGLAAIFLLLYWFLRHTVINRLGQLKRATLRMASGHYQIPIAMGGNDEIARVAEAFSVMGMAIGEREQTLRQSEERFRSLVENIDLGITWIDADYRVVMTNTGMGTLCGRPSSELTQRPCYEAFWGCQEVCKDCPGAQAMASRTPVSAEIENKRHNGSRARVQIHAFPTFAEGGEVTGFVEVVEDITRERQAEEALAESEGRFATLADVAPVMIWMTDAGRQRTFVNQPWLEFTGLSAEKAMGDGWAESIHHDDREGYLDTFKRAFEARESFTLEYRLQRHDGTYRWLLGTGTPRPSPAGTFIGYIGSCVDITEQKEVEKQLRELNESLEQRVLQRTQALRQSNEDLKDEIAQRTKAEKALKKSQEELSAKHDQLSMLFKKVETGKREWEQTMDCVDDLVLLIDDQGKIKRTNKALKDFWGKSFEEIIGTALATVLEAFQIGSIDYQSNAVEGFHGPSKRWFLLKTYPFEHDQEKGRVLVAHDFTQIKQMTQRQEDINRELEKKGNQLERAFTDLKNAQSKILHQEKMASIGQLAAGVAHEINNPMGFISSNLGTLDKYVGRLTEFIQHQGRLVNSPDPEALAELEQKKRQLKLDFITEDIKELIEESLDGAERVKKIVQDLKSFSRVDEAESQHMDIKECLESSINIVWNELKYKVTLNRDYAELPFIKCYPQQLNQVFLNLLVNAAHAIETQGEITVKTGQEKDRIYIAISDTGCGIPSDKVNRIFEPFFTTKEVGSGTGLVLSITYDIVKKHQGEIRVVSEEGQGTTFTVELPVVEEEGEKREC